MSLDARRVSRYAVLLVACATIALSLAAHRRAGLTFPPPWNDESWSLHKSLAFARDNTLFTPSINPERYIFTFPGYEVVMGVVFKLVPFSLPAARWVSWLALAGAYAGVLALLYKLPLRLLTCALASVFFCDAAFIVIGNIARPDILGLALGAWAFVAVRKNRPWEAFALAVLGTALHPNGIYACAVLALWILARYGVRLPRPAPLGILLSAAAVSAFVAYIVFIARHSSDLLGSLSWAVRHQFDEPGGGPSPLRNPNVWLVAAYAAAGLWTRRFSPDLVPLWLAGLTWQVTYTAGDEMWYQPHSRLGLMAFGCLVILLAAQAIDRWMPAGRPRVLARAAAVAALAIGLLAAGYRHRMVPGPPPYFAAMAQRWGMQIRDDTTYLPDDDRRAVTEAVLRLAGGRRETRVSFLPEGDALLFWPDLGSACVLYQPISTRLPPDIVVFHKTTFTPAWLRRILEDRARRKYGVTEEDLLVSRRRLHAWYVRATPGAAPR